MISVIVTSYNKGKYIEECLRSIINNTYKDLEILVVDDCSPDNSNEIIEKIMTKDSRVRLIKNKENVGAGMSRRIGIEAAEGEWISLIDADDTIEPNFYEALLSFLSVDEHIDMIYGRCKGDEHLPDTNFGLLNGREDSILKIASYKLQFLNAGLTRRSLYHDIEYCKSRFIEDTPTAVCLLYNARKVYVARYYGYIYRNVDTSLIHTSSKAKTYSYMYHNFIESIEWLKKRNENTAEKFRQSLIKDIYYNCTLHKYDYNDMSDGYESFWDEILPYYGVTKEKMAERKQYAIDNMPKMVHLPPRNKK